MTVQSLEREGANFDRRMPTVIRELESISESVEELIAPKLSTLRKSYSDFADKRAEVREALALYATVQDMERRRADLEIRLRPFGGVNGTVDAALPFTPAETLRQAQRQRPRSGPGRSA